MPPAKKEALPCCKLIWPAFMFFHIIFVLYVMVEHRRVCHGYFEPYWCHQVSLATYGQRSGIWWFNNDHSLVFKLFRPFIHCVILVSRCLLGADLIASTDMEPASFVLLASPSSPCSVEGCLNKVLANIIWSYLAVQVPNTYVYQKFMSEMNRATYSTVR